MEDKLIELLESLDYPVLRQGSLPHDEDYPDTFFTFWNNDDSEHAAYDNATAIANDNYSVNVYSTDPDKTYSLLKQARALLKSAGWIILTRGYDAPSDEITHTGRGMVIAYLQDRNL